MTPLDIMTTITLGESIKWHSLVCITQSHVFEWRRNERVCKLFAKCFGFNCRRIITCPVLPFSARSGGRPGPVSAVATLCRPNNTAGATSISAGTMRSPVGRRVAKRYCDNDLRYPVRPPLPDVFVRRLGSPRNLSNYRCSAGRQNKATGCPLRLFSLHAQFYSLIRSRRWFSASASNV